MKQLYTLNPDIASGDEFLDAYNKSIKTDNILKDLCNILFINPKPYVHGTIKVYFDKVVHEKSIEVIVRGMWRFVTHSVLDADKFSHKVDFYRQLKVRNILQIRYKRSLDPESLAKHEDAIQRIAARFKND
jgi:hypothetical protein